MVSTTQTDAAQSSASGSTAATATPTSAPAAGLEESLPGQVISAMFEPGRRVVYGVFTEAVEAASIPDEAERTRRREAAAETLTNIDDAERERRRTVGQVGLAVTGMAASGMLLFRAGPAARATLFFPLAFSLGYIESANTVDGSGLQRIEDSQLAEKIKARVNGLNTQTLVTALGVTAAFVTIPSLLGADEK